MAEGAKLVQLELPYDDVVKHAAQHANGDTLLIQDTSWEGYELVPQWIVDGYTTLTQEVDDQLVAAGQGNLSLVVVPAGVGSLAQALVHHYRSSTHRPAILACEPDTAASVTGALHAGHVVPVRTGDTVMTGLNCGTVSEIAWPTLRDGLDASVTVTDAQAVAAARELTSRGVDSGPCGAAALAALQATASAASRRDLLGLTPDSVVVLLSTEGTAANPKVALP